MAKNLPSNNKIAAVKWRDGDVVTFLQLYKQLDCLWNNKIPDYKDKEKRAMAYEALRRSMMITRLTVRDVKNKIKGLRTTYSDELNKILETSGPECERDYVPSVFWFNLADSFLRGVTKGRKNSAFVIETVRTIRMPQTRETIANYALQRRDSVSEIIMRRIENVDLVAVQAKYHRSCYDTFRFLTTSAEGSRKRGRPESNSTTRAMDEINTYIQNNDEECQFTINDLKSAVSGVCPDERTIIKKIKEKYGDQVTISSSNDQEVKDEFTIEYEQEVEIESEGNHLIYGTPSTSKGSPGGRLSKVENAMSLKHMPAGSEKNLTKEEDEYDLFGRSVAIQLRKLPELDALELMQKTQMMVFQKNQQLKRLKEEKDATHLQTPSSSSYADPLNMEDIMAQSTSQVSHY